jgi:hypothetical protein
VSVRRDASYACLVPCPLLGAALFFYVGIRVLSYLSRIGKKRVASRVRLAAQGLLMARERLGRQASDTRPRRVP